jgi:hypothetical protein
MRGVCKSMLFYIGVGVGVGEVGEEEHV